MFLLVPAHLGGPGQRAIKRCVCVCVCACVRACVRVCSFLILLVMPLLVRPVDNGIPD